MGRTWAFQGWPGQRWPCGERHVQCDGSRGWPPGPWAPFPAAWGAPEALEGDSGQSRTVLSNSIWGWQSAGGAAPWPVSPQGLPPTPPLLCSLKQILILLLPLPTSWPLGKSSYLRPSMVSPVKWRGVTITPPVGGGEGPDWL